MAYQFLVVDDSETVRAVVSKTLRLSGVEIGHIFEAVNGAAALDVLSKHWIDLVFADINMPVMNGLEMVEAMAANQLLSSVPVVIVSTEGSQTRIDHLREKGIRAYLRKPFSPEALRKVLTDILEVQHAR